MDIGTVLKIKIMINVINNIYLYIKGNYIIIILI